MSKEGKYTLETLLPLNVSYDYDHMLTQGDVDMVNSIVEVIESTRSECVPKVGDRIAYVRDDGSYHNRALIERKIDGYFRICTDFFILYIALSIYIPQASIASNAPSSSSLLSNDSLSTR